jgi:hypothetical protein
MVAGSTPSSIASTAHRHGGLDPSEQRTTVVEPAGTMTVVVFAAGGLLLLMQPQSSDDERIRAKNGFI